MRYHRRCGIPTAGVASMHDVPAPHKPPVADGRPPAVRPDSTVVAPELTEVAVSLVTSNN